MTAAGGAAGESGKSQMREPGRRQGRRELHEKNKMFLFLCISKANEIAGCE